MADEAGTGTGSVVPASLGEVARDSARAHKTRAALADALVAFACAAALGIAVVTWGRGPDHMLRWYEIGAGFTVGLVPVPWVVHRFRGTSVAVRGALIEIRNPWRTYRVDAGEAVVVDARRVGLSRCVVVSAPDRAQPITVVALAAE